MRELELRVALQLDEVANAASIVFDSDARGRGLVTHPIENVAGDVVATITFAPDGRLVDLELLNAANQLDAAALRAASDRRAES